MCTYSDRWRRTTRSTRSFVVLLALCVVLCDSLRAPNARASTYVVYVPLDDPIYQELETLNGLGFLDDYLEEIKPISRIEAARLTLEAQRNLETSQDNDPLAKILI